MNSCNDYTKSAFADYRRLCWIVSVHARSLGPMREPFTKLYVHLVWATWDRLPILSPELITIVDRAIRRECVELGVEVVAFGAVVDHVHLLVRIPSKLAVAALVKPRTSSTSG
jgi:putative transposase